MDALIAVDLQRDFCAGGALAVPGGDDVIEAVNELASRFDYVVATRDWHPPEHASFAERGGPWPPHCVQGTAGAELHADLRSERIHHTVDKGVHPESPGYSGFEQTELESLLRERGVERVHVVGLTLDYCVAQTALHARRAGFEVTVHRHATRAIEAQPGDADRAVADMRAAGIKVTGSG